MQHAIQIGESEVYVVPNPQSGTDDPSLSAADRAIWVLMGENDRLELERKDLAMLVRRLCRTLPESADMRLKALDYLRRKGLQGSPLRVDNSGPLNGMGSDTPGCPTQYQDPPIERT
jgi:hypothetical protein